MDERIGRRGKEKSESVVHSCGCGEFGESLRVWSSEGVSDGGSEDPVRSLLILLSWEDLGL